MVQVYMKAQDRGELMHFVMDATADHANELTMFFREFKAKVH